jgi:hypothetical protein
MLFRSGGPILGVCALLSGCAAPAQPDPPPLAVSPPLATSSSFNGSYNGMMQLSSGSPDSCGTQDIFTLRVTANGFQYVLRQPQVPWRPSVAFAVGIAPDGSFGAASGGAFINGRIAQGHMQGQIVGDACGYSFQADNTGSF